jgi:hypothetical protein
MPIYTDKFVMLFKSVCWWQLHAQVIATDKWFTTEVSERIHDIFLQISCWFLRRSVLVVDQSTDDQIIFDENIK